jgi:hypothetical protein
MFMINIGSLILLDLYTATKFLGSLLVLLIKGRKFKPAPPGEKIDYEALSIAQWLAGMKEK